MSNDKGMWHTAPIDNFRAPYVEDKMVRPNIQYYKQHPSGKEPQDIANTHTYNVGTAIVYLMRSPYKHDHPLEDIKKARDHLNFEIDRLEGAIKP